MCNVTVGITQQPLNIFGHKKLQKFRYDDYLAIHSFISLSYVVGVDAQLVVQNQVGEFRMSATII